MHCDVDLRSRRMWAASYRLTRLVMNEDSHVPRGPDTGHCRVLTRRHGNGDDGAVADARMLGRWLVCLYGYVILCLFSVMFTFIQ